MEANIGIHLRNIAKIKVSCLRKLFLKYLNIIEIAVRKNYIICEKNWYILSHAKLPNSFRGEVMRIVIDLTSFSCDFS